jgi:sodium-dependent phosphate cotransporter
MPKTGEPTSNRRSSVIGRAVAAAGLLYCFFLSITMLSGGLKLFGTDFGEALIATTDNPFVGLMAGILVTSLVQSSSVTTSLVVGFVASGQLSIANAVPIIMGANIGTTCTNTIVSLGHITRLEEFRKALSVAVLHDFFNVLVVAVLLPLEMAFGMLEHFARALAGSFAGVGGLKYTSPIKQATKPVVEQLVKAMEGLDTRVAAGITVVAAALLLFTSLYFLVRVLRTLMAQKLEAFFDRFLGGNPIRGLALGLVVTALIQSSSVTTSLLVPLAAAGILKPAQALPVTLGANLGTTFTCILAALTGNVNAITIAFVHLLFNLVGTVMVLPFRSARRIPIVMAERFAALAARRRAFAFLFVGAMFYGIPGALVLLGRAL